MKAFCVGYRPFLLAHALLCSALLLPTDSLGMKSFVEAEEMTSPEKQSLQPTTRVDRQAHAWKAKNQKARKTHAPQRRPVTRSMSRRGHTPFEGTGSPLLSDACFSAQTHSHSPILLGERHDQQGEITSPFLETTQEISTGFSSPLRMDVEPQRPVSSLLQLPSHILATVISFLDTASVTRLGFTHSSLWIMASSLTRSVLRRTSSFLSQERGRETHVDWHSGILPTEPVGSILTIHAQGDITSLTPLRDVPGITNVQEIHFHAQEDGFMIFPSGNVPDLPHLRRLVFDNIVPQSDFGSFLHAVERMEIRGPMDRRRHSGTRSNGNFYAFQSLLFYADGLLDLPRLRELYLSEGLITREGIGSLIVSTSSRRRPLHIEIPHNPFPYDFNHLLTHVPQEGERNQRQIGQTDCMGLLDFRREHRYQHYYPGLTYPSTEEDSTLRFTYERGRFLQGPNRFVFIPVSQENSDFTLTCRLDTLLTVLRQEGIFQGRNFIVGLILLQTGQRIELLHALIPGSSIAGTGENRTLRLPDTLLKKLPK